MTDAASHQPQSLASEESNAEQHQCEIIYDLFNTTSFHAKSGRLVYAREMQYKRGAGERFPEPGSKLILPSPQVPCFPHQLLVFVLFHLEFSLPLDRNGVIFQIPQVPSGVNIHSSP